MSLPTTSATAVRRIVAATSFANRCLDRRYLLRFVSIIFVIDHRGRRLLLPAGDQDVDINTN